MAENTDLTVPRDPVRQDQDLMAAVGRMVAGAAEVEHSVAVLVAVTEGGREHGAPVRELRKLAAGLPERRDLTWLCRNAEAALEGRDVVVHAISPEDITADAEGGLFGWHPRTGEEIWLTTPT